MAITKETYKEAKQFRTQMLVIGLITLPIGIGLIFLGMWYNLKEVMDKYDEAIKLEEND